jgi:hypothetical protein
MEKFIPKSPDKFLKKDADMALAKFGHLNAIVDKINETLYTEVAISSANILSIESSPVQLLPAPGVGKYYEYHGTVEYTHVSTNYTTTSMTSIGVVTEGNFAGSFISPTLISTAASGVAGFSSVGTNPYNTPAVIDQDAVNQPIIIAGIGANPTLGDGTMLVKIWYKIRTFGTEL